MTTKLRPNKKAIAIAQDVLLRLRRHLKVVTGAYCDGYLPVSEVKVDADLRENLPVIEKNCEVCALGACLLSKARLYNNVPTDDVTRPTGLLSYMLVVDFSN